MSKRGPGNWGHGTHYLKPETARKMSAVQRAYVGAMLDAEGSVGTRQDGAGWSIGIPNTDLEIISALLRATGTGHVFLQGNSMRNGRKPLWVWKVSTKRDTRAIARQVRRYSTKAQAFLGEVAHVRL